MTKKEMKNIDAILSNGLFQKNMADIERLEQNRAFCRHGMAHLLDVARIACLIALEEGDSLEKEVIYAAALLHDIGRAVQYETGEDHAKAGVRISEQILKSCSFTKAKQQAILSAVDGHRIKTAQNGRTLSDLISRADQMSRMCFCCSAKDQCYWPEEKKNMTIYY